MGKSPKVAMGYYAQSDAVKRKHGNLLNLEDEIDRSGHRQKRRQRQKTPKRRQQRSVKEEDDLSNEDDDLRHGRSQSTNNEQMRGSKHTFTGCTVNFYSGKS